MSKRILVGRTNRIIASSYALKYLTQVDIVHANRRRRVEKTRSELVNFKREER